MNAEQIAKLDQQLRKEVDLEYREYLIREIPKGEALLPSVMRKSANPADRSAVVRNLTLLNLALNRQLASVCRAVGYPLDQLKWPDSQPLEILDQIYSSGLAASPWYQRHLGAMIQASGHPWVALET